MICCLEIKPVLVTGGIGFPGSRPWQDLLEEGHEVLWPDPFFSGRCGDMGVADGVWKFAVFRELFDNLFPFREPRPEP